MLDDEGQAVGPWDPALEPSTLVAGLRHMLLVRELDRRMLTAQRQGKASFYMQSLGEEAVACGFRAAQRPGDMNFPTYRQQGWLVAREWRSMCRVNSIPVRARSRWTSSTCTRA